jgi:hypothetical protein
MLKRYAIWDKKTPVITPTYEVFTAEQWLDKYPAAKLPNITVVCSAGEVNGGYFGSLNQMVASYTRMGCDFSDCTTDEDKLMAIEMFEDIRTSKATPTVSAEERIAAALEYQNLLAMDDVE